MNAAGIRNLPLARLYLAAGIAATGLYFLLPWNSRGQSLLYDLVGATSGVIVIVGVRINRPSLPASWYLFAGGLVAFATGDLIFNLYDWVWHRSPPIPSLADVFYLAGYPFLTVGIVLLVLRMRSEERRAGLVDATLLATAFGVCQWVFVMHPLASGSGRWTENAVALAYPAMDVLLLAGLLFLALTPAWRTVAYRYLAASIVLLVVVDEIYALSPESFPGTSFLDAGWLLSYVLWGVAALSPSMRELSEPTSPPSPRLTRGSSRRALGGGSHCAGGSRRRAFDRPPDRLGGDRDRCGGVVGARPDPPRRFRQVTRPSARSRALGAGRGSRDAPRARAQERAAARGRPPQGRVRRADLARPAHAAHLDHRLSRADARRRQPERRTAWLSRASPIGTPTVCSTS